MIAPGAVPTDVYWRRCAIMNVHDADTMLLSIDCAFGIDVTMKLRLAGVNAPELVTDAGKAALAFADEWFAEHMSHWKQEVTRPFMVRYNGWDNYGGRFDGVLICPSEGSCLNDELLRSGHAVPMR